MIGYKAHLPENLRLAAQPAEHRGHDGLRDAVALGRGWPRLACAQPSMVAEDWGGLDGRAAGRYNDAWTAGVAEPCL
jgi:hypothetical protein